MEKLHAKSWTSRYILLNSIAQRLQKHTFSIIRQHLWISLPLFWFRSCTKDFQRDFGNFNVNFEATKRKCYLSERYVITKKDNSRRPHGKGYCQLLVTLIPKQTIAFLGLTIEKVLDTSSSPQSLHRLNDP